MGQGLGLGSEVRVCQVSFGLPDSSWIPTSLLGSESVSVDLGILPSPGVTPWQLHLAEG